MGIRLRYTGGEYKKKRNLEAVLPWDRSRVGLFTKGEVVDLRKPQADALLREYPADFERVLASGEGYEDAQAPRTEAAKPVAGVDPPTERRAVARASATEDGSQEKSDSDWVTLRVKRKTAVANNPRDAAQKVVFNEGETFRIPSASATHYMSHLPETFEKVGD